MLWHDTTVFPDWLRRRADTTPDRLALIAGQQQLTFAALNRQVDLSARWLLSQGVKNGDHVAIHLPNSIAFVTLVHALPRLGAVLVPINLRLTPEEIAWQLADAEVQTFVTTPDSADLVTAMRRQLPAITIIEIDPHTQFGDETQVDETTKLESVFNSASTHSIIYTSGTTGLPKGALLTFGNHWWSAIGSGLNLGVHADDRWMAVLPLFHVGGLSILLRSVIYGITVVVHESFDATTVNESIDGDRVTIISVVSTMLRRMLADRGETPYPDWLRCVLLGGGPAPGPLLETCAQRGIPVTQTYGLTESASQIATLSPEDALAKLGSAGKPLYPNEIMIDGNGQSAAPGIHGEILVRGPIITAGYFQQPDVTEYAFRDGWFHTGDAGYLDEDGYLYVLDRRDDLIVTGGENVYPAEIEAVLSGHPDVDEAGVVGVPDPEWGHRVVGVISCSGQEEPDVEAIRAWCQQRIARYKVPTELRSIGEPLPRNAGGKLLRRTIRSWFDS
jgi:o-succinylbenzoate---CoA ligase